MKKIQVILSLDEQNQLAILSNVPIDQESLYRLLMMAQDAIVTDIFHAKVKTN